MGLKFTLSFYPSTPSNPKNPRKGQGFLVVKKFKLWILLYVFKVLKTSLKLKLSIAFRFAPKIFERVKFLDTKNIQIENLNVR